MRGQKSFRLCLEEKLCRIGFSEENKFLYKWSELVFKSDKIIKKLKSKKNKKYFSYE